MSGLGFSVAPTKHISIQELLRLARLAEVLGYDSVWIPETWGVDAVSVLALLAESTTRISLAAGVLNVYSRSAALVAQTAATLQEISGNRFILGLGASGPIVVQDWHGITYDRPLERTRDYIAVIRLALEGKRVNYRGPTTSVQNFKLLNPPAEPVPIYVAALGPKNIRLAAEISDGWLPIFASRGRMAPLMREFERALSDAGRHPASADIAAYIPSVVGPRAEQLLRLQLAYYVGGMGTFYARLMEHMGFTQEAGAIRDRWDSGDRRGAAAAVSSEMLSVCTLGLAPHLARTQVDEYVQNGVRSPILTLPSGCSVEEAEHTLETFAPAAARD